MKILPFGVAVIEDDSHLSKWIEEQGTLKVADGFCKLFRRYIPDGGVVADIGACLGDHTATYSEMVGPRGWVHCFEANPKTVECLAHNVKNMSNVILHPYGLGDRQTTASVVVNAQQELNLGASQLREGGSIRIEPLDLVAQHWTKLDFVKIDAEGYEPKIVRGAMKTFARFRPVLLVEINRPVLAIHGASDSDIFVPLSSLGYSFKPCEPHLSLDMPQIDVLCLPK